MRRVMSKVNSFRCIAALMLRRCGLLLVAVLLSAAPARADDAVADGVVALGAVGGGADGVEHDPEDLVVGPGGVLGPDEGGAGGG